MDLLIDEYFDAQLALVEKSLSQTERLNVNSTQKSKQSKDQPSQNSDVSDMNEAKKGSASDIGLRTPKNIYMHRSRKFRYDDSLATPSKSTDDSSMIPPPPTFVPVDVPQSENGDQAQASMLMSWYMAGYHTGYYEAMKKFKVDGNDE